MVYVGIDVAKNKHDVCILDTDGKECGLFTIGNDKVGFEKLLSTISSLSMFKDRRDVKIGLESTGHYSTNIANFLTNKRLSVKIFNPFLITSERKAQSLRRIHTDKSDCKFLAMKLFSDESKPYSPPVLPVSELKILTRNRSRLVAMRSKLKVSVDRLVTVLFPELPSVVYSVNQKSCYAIFLKYPTAVAIVGAHLTTFANLLSDNSGGKYGKDKALAIRALAADSIGLNNRAAGLELQQTIRLIQNLQDEIDTLEKEIKSVMDELKSPITTIPGIGYVLGAIIISEIGDVNNFDNPAKLLAFAGLDPTIHQSGKYTATSTPMVKHGSAYLRWALLQAARSVAYREPVFSAYMAKKRAEGKHYFVAQSHVARKLVRVIHHLLTHNVDFDSQAATTAA